MNRPPAWYASRTTVDAHAFQIARNTLLENYDTPSGLHHFQWPSIDHFNWSLHWFDLHAADNPTIALVGHDLQGTWREITYDELAYASDNVANNLRKLGVQPGDHIVIDSSSRCELWAVLLGTLKCGAVCIPVHHGLHPESLTQRLETALPAFYLATHDRGPIEYGKHILIDTDLVRWGTSSQFIPQDQRSSDQPAFGCFTSGTTGRPKLALHSHRTHGLAHMSSMYWNRLDTGQRHLNISSPGWAKFFWSSLLVPLTSGATIVVRPDDLGTADFPQFVADHDVQSVCAPVSFLRNVSCAHPKPPSLGDIMSVGEAVSATTRAHFREHWKVHVREGFGQTEATAILGELRCIPGAMHALPGYRVRLAEDPSWPAPRLMFHSFANGSFLGYLRDGVVEPPETDAHGWQWTGDYATGDISRGTVQLLGRGDDVFKCNGHLVSPTEVEAILETHHLVQSAAVVAVDDRDGGKNPHAFVTLAEGAESDCADSVLAWLNERLPPDVDAAQVHVTAELPRSINGKIQRNALAGSYQR